MIDIRNSPISYCFDDAISVNPPSLNVIAYLESVEAEFMWEQRFGIEGRNFHSLPVTSIYSNLRWESVGNWIEAFNGKFDKDVVPRIVKEISGWSSSERLLLVKDKKNSVALSLKGFKDYWIALLCGFDDGPVLVAEDRESGHYFQFTPLGTIQLGVFRAIG